MLAHGSCQHQAQLSGWETAVILALGQREMSESCACAVRTSTILPVVCSIYSIRALGLRVRAKNHALNTIY
jgi:hypothetical protein